MPPRRHTLDTFGFEEEHNLREGDLTSFFFLVISENRHFGKLSPEKLTRFNIFYRS